MTNDIQARPFLIHVIYERMIRPDFVYLNGLMVSSSNNYFLSTICHLREQEEMLIYDRFTSTSITEERAVGDFLQEEYEREMLDFPGNPPSFDRDAAVWAARIIFNASQLLLSREKDEKDIVQLLPHYTGETTPGAFLSADLCLRCLPDVIGKAREINPDDSLILLLEEILRIWHYSGIGYFGTGVGAAFGAGVEVGLFDWKPIMADDCLRSLYTDRVIERKVTVLANIPALRPWILAAMGDHSASLWKEL